MLKILLVDDEADLCFFLKKNMEDAGGFEVSTCSESGKALILAKELQPDLVILDVLMPGLSGPEVAGQIKTDPRMKNTPVIFLTAIATEQETASKMNFVGGQFVVAKPVQMDHLLKVIYQAVKSSSPAK